MPSFEGREERMRGENLWVMRRSKVGLKVPCEFAIM